MNRLQNLAVPERYCVTLNANGKVAEKTISREINYAHPLMTSPAPPCTGAMAGDQWGNHTHFCGAYRFYGFHEDGLNSAIRVAQSLNASWKPGA